LDSWEVVDCAESGLEELSEFERDFAEEELLYRGLEFGGQLKVGSSG
jgi:hypothetical protein